MLSTNPRGTASSLAFAAPGPQGPLDFPELDLKRVQKDLGVEAAARENGRLNLPPQDSAALDAEEQTVASRFLGERTALYNEVLTQLRIYAERFNGLRFQDRISGLEHLPAEAEARLLSLRNTRLDGLRRLREDMRELARERADFAAEHGLARTPRYPESRLLRWGVLLVILLVETVLNGMFFARGHELGLFGGVTQALALSVINISVGLLMGLKVFPYVQHKGPARNVLAWAACAAWLAFVAVFNVAVAHYREAFALHPLEAARLAVDSLVARPLGLGEFDSWLLLLLGLICSAVAFADGAGMDDPYPGFGRIDRRLRTAEQDLWAGKQATLDEIDRIKDVCVAGIDAAVRDIEARRAEAQSILLAFASLTRKYRTHREYLERCCNTVLRTYRDCNQAARSTLPPARFAEPWRFPADDELPAPPVLDPQVLVQIAQVLDTVSGHKTRVLAGHARTVEEFRQLDGQGLGEARA